MPVIHVFGHKNPDSDSICSAIVVADWLNFTHRPAKAWRLGNITPETQYILEQAKVESPPLLDIELNNEKVWLVDFSEVEQGPKSLPQSQIIGLVDHHRLGNLTTSAPLDAWLRGVGCTATIVSELLRTTPGFVINQQQAILLAGAIFSDTIFLTSPTTTQADHDAINYLLPHTQLNPTVFYRELMTAKTDIGSLNISDLLSKDEKEYNINGYHIVLSQIEVSSQQDINHLIDALANEMTLRKNREKYDLYITIVTLLTTSESILYFTQGGILSYPPLTMANTVSRKKQILPWLTEMINKLPTK